MKKKQQYLCSECGATSNKWSGQCANCGEWNTLSEHTSNEDRRSSRFNGYANERAEVLSLSDVEVSHEVTMDTGLKELDRALGKGLVAGSVVLIGGDPGIGKSTLLIQCLAYLSQDHPVLYVTGEESLQQVSFRAKRLGLKADTLKLFSETQVESIIDVARKQQPHVMVVDSIQTIFTDSLSSAPGGVSQVRESAAQLVRFAKASNTALFLVGHVTKEGALAGPRVLEHMVDTVLYFEGQSDSRFRVIRAVKNRFGAVNELGVFAMTDKGLREVSNPSAIFLSQAPQPTPGSVVMVTWEGSRPMLVEVQALVDTSHGGNPRRLALGMEQNRLAMLLAVLHRHGDIASYDQDVFVNVVGGMRVTETGVDLALLVAVISSLKGQVIDKGLIVFGEVGLAGEIRPVQSGQERLYEAVKHGFSRAIIPEANAPKKDHPTVKIHRVKHLSDVIAVLRDE